MAMTEVWLKIDEQRVVQELRRAGEKLDPAGGEVVLDFSAVGRIDTGTLQALKEFADIANQQAVKVVLCGVNVHVYKVLKLMKLEPRFSFLTSRNCPAPAQGN